MAEPIVPPTNDPDELSENSFKNAADRPAEIQANKLPVRVSDSLFNKLKRIATSTLFLILAFIIVHALLQLLMGIISHFLNYDVKVNYNNFLVHPRDYHHWNKGRIFAVYLIPPVFCLFMGFMLLNYLRVNPDWIKPRRMLVFWLMICFGNICLAHLFFSPLGVGAYNEPDLATYQTFAVVATWMFFTASIMGAFTALSIIISIVYGVITRDEILRFSRSNRATQKPGGKNSLVFQLYILPVIFAFFPLWYLSEYFLPTLFIYSNLFIIGFGMLIRNFNDNKSTRPDKSDTLNHLPIIELVVVAVVWMAVYFFYSFGHFLTINK